MMNGAFRACAVGTAMDHGVRLWGGARHKPFSQVIFHFRL